MSAAPHVVFVPGGGAVSAGESIRSLVLADALRANWPDCRVGFIAEKQHVGLPESGFERHAVSDRVSKSVAEVNGILRELAPDVVVFDCRGRGRQIAGASRIGARTVYVAAQPQTLRRTFRWQRLRHLDELWVMTPTVGGPEGRLTNGQRLSVRLARGPQVRFFDAIYPEPDARCLEALRHRCGMGDDPFVLFAAGGGGYEQAGRPVSELFAEAAHRLHRGCGTRCVAVMGPLYRGSMRSLEGVTIVDALEPREMISLLAGAELAVCGGGDLMGQAVALGKRCVGAPAGGSDQPEHIRVCAARGLIEAAPLDPVAIAEVAGRLLADRSEQAQLRERVLRAGRRNGLLASVRCLEQLVGDPA